MLTERTRERFEIFAKFVRRKSAAGRWLVLTHDNPDPDSIAAAAGLAKLLRRAFRRQATIAYGGIIGRAENQEMVKVLGARLSHVRHLNWSHYKHFALVDAQPSTGNNQLNDLLPDIVFDHHPIRRLTRKVAFTDIRTDYGATATIVAEYLAAAGWDLTKKEATAFLYAVRSETQDFAREFSLPDKALFDELLPQADLKALARIMQPRLPLSYFRNLHEALENLQAVGSLVVSQLGELDQPDIVPEIADLMLRLEGKTWSMCSGIHGGRIYVSIRTTNSRADAGNLMRRLLGRRGKGGGHGMMAGGWIDYQGTRGSDPRALQQYLAQRLASILKRKANKLLPLLMSPPSTISDDSGTAEGGGA
ncbi:MAG: DHH family phosphoesterase [Acidobacteriota bacterium]|nr:DHH family phosphoesterase [Acidobacteriota bacterium]